MIETVVIHALCAALVAADIVARMFRLQWVLRGLGSRISLGEAFVVNIFGDAAAALTPLRIGGHPARFAGLLHAGVPGGVAVAGIALEAVITNATAVIIGALLAVFYAPEWWSTIAPALAGGARRFLPWLAVIGAASIVVWLLIQRRAGGRPATSTAWFADVVRSARGMPAWPLLAAVPLSAIGVLARVLLLPLLVLALETTPPMGAVVMGSFALLYSQIFLPTPAGAGAVEIGFLAGIAGNLGETERRLLFFWRLYTLILPAVLGVAVALSTYGRTVVSRVLLERGRAGR